MFAGLLLPGVPLKAAPGFTVAWTNNLLTLVHPDLPGGRLEVLYLEAFCRQGARTQDWRQTTLPHHTQLLSASRDGRRLRFLTRVPPDGDVSRDVKAQKDEIE